jgi:hypothetical protein
MKLDEIIARLPNGFGIRVEPTPDGRFALTVERLGLPDELGDRFTVSAMRTAAPSDALEDALDAAVTRLEP